MRLICPNCDAQYAVADDIIPNTGRDVQCSNCQHTWFEIPENPIKTVSPKAVLAPTIPPNRFSGSINDAFKDIDETQLAPAPQPPKNRRPVDPSVADILREEAALEAAQRKTETPPRMESQSDMDLRDPFPPLKQDTLPKVTPSEATNTPIPAASQPTRRDLLPDIEEINSSLRSNAERVDDSTGNPDATAEENRKSFRRGFMLVLLLVVIFVVIYVQADQISAAIPAVSAALQSYVDTVDLTRIWLDDTVQRLLTVIAPAST